MSVLRSLEGLFTIILLFFAVDISASPMLKTMIDRYQQQAFILAVFVFFTAATTPNAPATTNAPHSANVVMFLVAFLPLSMSLAIKPILARATLVAPQEKEWQPFHHLRALRWRTAWREIRAMVAEAELTWLEHGRLRLPPGYSFIVDATLTTLAFVIAFNLSSTVQVTSFAVSMALLMLGLFVMINNEDLLAQVIGLLVTEHGLFLAAIKVISQKNVAVFFAVSLFFYLTLTLTILLWVLPSLRQASESLEVRDQTQLRG
ncbi:MAG: hypothetical protein GXO55_06635 [Chloroflexi bacterium]|nr:hypothetical protein [Chloroflexota bacterium]